MLTLSNAQSETRLSHQSYFSGYSSDGSPVLENYCGVNYEKKGWLSRSLEGDVSSEVGTAYEERRSITFTLLFRFSDEKHGKLELRPEEIKLYVSASNKLLKPDLVERKPYNPRDIRCDILQYGEWITLKFLVPPEQVEQVALVFPKGAVSRNGPMDIRPFRFERIDFSPNGTPGPPRTQISVPALPPVSPRFAPFETATAMPSSIKGNWVIDGKATEEVVAKLPRPPHAYKLAQWFSLVSGYMALFTYEFDGDMAKSSAFRGNRTQEFERVANQNTETTYALKDTTGSKPQTMSVSMLQNGNIRIVPSESPEISYLRWKPGTHETEAATPDDVMSESRIWLTSVQAIIEMLKEPSVATMPHAKAVSHSHIAIEKALNYGVIRKATEEDKKAFFDAYVQKKYSNRNLAVPDKEDALAVLNVDISRAYVVLKKFVYPLGMINENRVVFFTPKGVPEPTGEIGHSAVYDFTTLTVGCSLARTGSLRC